MWKWKSLFVTTWIVVHGISQARILEWIAFFFSKRSSQPMDRTQVFCIAGRFFTGWTTRKALVKVRIHLNMTLTSSDIRYRIKGFIKAITKTAQKKTYTSSLWRNNYFLNRKPLLFVTRFVLKIRLVFLINFLSYQFLLLTSWRAELYLYCLHILIVFNLYIYIYFGLLRWR